MATTVPTPVDHPQRTLPPGARTQVLGLALLAAAPLTMAVIGLLTGVPAGDLVLFVVIGAVLATAAFLAGRFGTWARVLGVVLTIAAALGGFWIAFGLFAPTSPGDFVPGVLLVVGVVLALVGGIRATARRRQAAPSHAGEDRTRVVALGVVVVALVGSVAGNVLARSSVDEAAAAGATPVEMSGFEFAPEPVEATTGGALLVRNRDGFLHDLAIPTHDLEVTVTPGSEALLDVSSLAPGTYTFYCTLHSDTSVEDPDEAGMAGTLVVR